MNPEDKADCHPEDSGPKEGCERLGTEMYGWTSLLLFHIATLFNVDKCKLDFEGAT